MKNSKEKISLSQNLLGNSLQDHEQKKKNVVFNGDRGAVGLKEDPGALRWWVVEAAGV